MKYYKLTVLIPSWNGEKYIENCIKSILENDYENYQIISIAGGTDQGYNFSLKLNSSSQNKAMSAIIGGINFACKGILKANARNR